MKVRYLKHMNPITLVQPLLPTLKNILSINKRDLWLAVFALLIFVTGLAFATHFMYASELVSKQALMSHNEAGAILYDRNNQPFFTFYQAKSKTYVPLSEIPKHVQQAVVAAEDGDFYDHAGFSIKAIVRSAVDNVKKGDTAYGGSTITQQLVKNALLNSQKSFIRKFQEIVIAERVDREFTKEEILEMYLNSVYFGNGAYGIDAASKTYFSKQAKDLNLAEASILAGILPSPSKLSPEDLGFAKHRQDYVLTKMVQKGYLASSQKEEVFAQEINFKPQEDDLNEMAPHFALMVKDQLIKQFGEDEVQKGGYKVYTTLDLKWQQYAEDAVYKHLRNMDGKLVKNMTAVAVDPKNGEVKALVGSYSWYDEKDGKVNAATDPRQPGSSFKPIVYLTAFEEGELTPASIIEDKPVTITVKSAVQPIYKPVNYDGRFRGNVTVRRALSNSLNIPAVETIQKVGIEDTLDMAQRLGITTLGESSNYGPSLALGAGEVSLFEMVQAFSVIANNGEKNDLVLINRVVDKYGQTLYAHKPDPKQVVDPKYTYQISSILSDNNTRSEVFGSNLNISRVAAVKTGTTDKNIDAWTIGYTPSLVVGIRVGNNDHSPMNNVYGSLGAAPAWKDLMETFLKGTPIEQFKPPQGLVVLTVCKSNGLILEDPSASPSAGYKEYFVEGTQPRGKCTLPTPTPQPTDQPPTDQPSTPQSTQPPPSTDQPQSQQTREIIIDLGNRKKDRED